MQRVGIADLILPSCKKIAGLARVERAKPLIAQRSNLVLSGLFKPRSSPRGAGGKDQIAVGIEDLDCGATLEAVGAGEM
jgi:hypothetical protein